MTFRLFYRGPLKSSNLKEKWKIRENQHEIRLKIHDQLTKLWEQERNKGYKGLLTKDNKQNILYTVGDQDYACLITDRLEIYAELDILFLRPGEPGRIIQGGDIDNRLKTLFDALRRPIDPQEMPKDDLLSQTPDLCHCLLSDDSLITRVSVTTDTLLDAQSEDEVVLIITVTVMRREATWINVSYMQ